MVYKKLVISILITTVLISSAYSAHATDWFYAVKEIGLDVAGRAIASALLRSMTNRLVQKIQGSGEGGGPAFVQNWTNFQTANQYRGEDAFRAILASTPLCDYLDQNIKDTFGVKSTQIKPPLGQNVRVGNLDPFKLRAGCTMPSNFNLVNYQNDFSGNGGWSAWSRMLEPQNNYYGLLFGSLDEVARQRDLYEQAASGEVQAGSGYTSIRGACRGRFEGTSQARCVFMGQIFTPADLLGKTAATTIDKDLEGIINSDELAETLIAIGNALVSRLVNLAGDSLSGSTDPDSENPNDIRSQKAWTEQNQKEEYCSASEPTQEAIDLVRVQNPKTYADFPISGCSGLQCVPGVPGFLPGGESGGNSYCDQFRDEENAYPYQRCILACFKSLEVIPPNIAAPAKPTPKPTPATTAPPEGGGTCPIGLSTGTLDHSDVVDSVITQIGPTQTTHTACDQFEITKNVAWILRGEGAGLQKKNSGTNCAVGGQGYSVDIIAYPNGDAYDVVADQGTTWGATWSPTCLIDPTTQYTPAFNPGGAPIPTGPISGTLRSDFATCTKGALSGNPNCDVVLNYTTTNTSGAEIRKDGALWQKKANIGSNYPAGTQIDADPVPGTYTYTLFGFDANDIEALLASVTVTVQ